MGTRARQVRNVAYLSTRETATATTRTTTKGVPSMAATVVLKPCKKATSTRSTARSASASTPRKVVDLPTTLETAIATTTTTAQGVLTMAATAAPALLKVAKL